MLESSLFNYTGLEALKISLFCQDDSLFATFATLLVGKFSLHLFTLIKSINKSYEVEKSKKLAKRVKVEQKKKNMFGQGFHLRFKQGTTVNTLVTYKKDLFHSIIKNKLFFYTPASPPPFQGGAIARQRCTSELGLNNQ